MTEKFPIYQRHSNMTEGKMKKESLTKVPTFSMKEISDVKFGGFAVDNHLCAGPDKHLYRSKTLPQAMILAADQGKGFHLTTSFEWSSMAYLWQKAKTLNDCTIDLHEETWQWVMGLFMNQDGHVDILANLDVTYGGSPYGRGTISKSGKANLALVCDGEGSNWLKEWSPGIFDGMSVYIAEANNSKGEFFPISRTTKNSIILPKSNTLTNGTATFCILKHVSTDVTAGMNSGDRITSLRESDDDLKPFAIPGSLDNKGKAEFGFDKFWFYKVKEKRAALRGGYFNDAAGAGVFCLSLDGAPSYSNCYFGFRACKAL